MKLGGWLVMLTAIIMFLSLLGLPAGLDGILNTIGVDVNETTSALQSADIENSNFWSRLFNGTSGILITLGAAAAVTIGLYVKTGDTNILLLPFIVFVGTLYISTFWAVIKLVIDLHQPWLTSIIGIIFGALAVGFAMSCFDYFAGR